MAGEKGQGMARSASSPSPLRPNFDDLSDEGREGKTNHRRGSGDRDRQQCPGEEDSKIESAVEEAGVIVFTRGYPCCFNR